MSTKGKAEVSDQELKKVIADFLEMGHVDNIVAMFKADTRYYDWVDDLLADERFAVRLGVSVLFEELREVRPGDLELAVPALERAVASRAAHVRGEAVSVLGIIGGPVALAHARRLADDPEPAVAETARAVLEELEADAGA